MRKSRKARNPSFWWTCTECQWTSKKDPGPYSATDWPKTPPTRPDYRCPTHGRSHMIRYPMHGMALSPHHAVAPDGWAAEDPYPQYPSD